MLSNAYYLAKFRFDTAEKEPAKNLKNFAKNPVLQSPLAAYAITASDAQVDFGLLALSVADAAQLRDARDPRTRWQARASADAIHDSRQKR